MLMQDLVDAVAAGADLTKEQARDVVHALTDTITDTLCRSERVNLTGFGSFSVQQRSARQGRNPQTGESIQIPASQQVVFKPGKRLKDSVNG